MLSTLWIYTLVLAFICIGVGLVLFLVWDVPSLRAEVSGRARLKQVHDLTASDMGLADLYMVHNVNRDLTMSWKPVQEEMEKVAEGMPEPVGVSDTPDQGIVPKPIVSKHRALSFPEVDDIFMWDSDDSDAGGVALLEEMLDESKPLTVPDIETSLMDSDAIEDVNDDTEETPTDFMTTPDVVEEFPTDLMEDAEISHDYEELPTDFVEAESVEETPTDTLNDVDEDSYVSDEGTDDPYDDIEETPTGFIDDIEENSSITLLDQFSNKLSTGRLDVVEEQGNYDE